MAISTLVSKISKSTSIVDPITFAQSPNFLGINLFPLQKFIIKIVYGMELDDNLKVPIVIKDKFNEVVLEEFYSETEFLYYLYDNDYINSLEFDESIIEMVLVIGRRGTKTTISSIITAYTLYLLLMKESPHEYLGVIKQSEVGIAICSNNKDNASRQLREVSAFIYGSKWFKPFLVSKEPAAEGFFLKSSEQISNPESKIGHIFVSVFAASPSVRGASNLIVIMDEYAHFIDSEVSTKSKPLDKLLYEALTPSVSGFSDPDGKPLGRAMIITSPNGKKGEVWKRKKTSRDDKSQLFMNIPSWWINANLASAFLRKMYNESEASFWQEYGAKFVEKESGWIENMAKFRSMRDLALSNSKNNGTMKKRYYVGVDLALSGDGTAISVISYSKNRGRTLEDEKHNEHITNEGVYAIEYVWYKLPAKGQILSVNEIIVELLSIKEQFNVVGWAFDQWAYDMFDQWLQEKNIKLKNKMKVSSTQESNSNMARFFKALMNEGKIVLPNDDDLFYELEALKETLSGKHIKVENTSGHDDRFTSILRALWIAQSDPRRGDINENRITTHRQYETFKKTHHKPLQQLRNRTPKKRRR